MNQERWKAHALACCLLSVCLSLVWFVLGVVVRCRAEGSTGTRNHHTGGLSPPCGAPQEHSVSTVRKGSRTVLRRNGTIELDEGLSPLLPNQVSASIVVDVETEQMISMLGFLLCPIENQVIALFLSTWI